jgi:hypothetical protein
LQPIAERLSLRLSLTNAVAFLNVSVSHSGKEGHQMNRKLLLGLVGGALAASISNVYAQSDDDKKKPADPPQLILSQSDDEGKKPRKPGGETPPPEHAQIVAQSDDEPKKPKKPKEPDRSDS